jgi:hypothetical protein
VYNARNKNIENMNTDWEKKESKRRNIALLLSIAFHVLIISWIWYNHHMEEQPKEDDIDKIENTISESREAFLQS